MTEELRPFANKSKAMADLLAGLAKANTGKDPRDGYCATCGEAIDQAGFRDDLSRREYTISGMCQVCQDSVFGPSAEPTGKCPNCGGYCYEGATLCSDRCEHEYMAYLNDAMR